MKSTPSNMHHFDVLCFQSQFTRCLKDPPTFLKEAPTSIIDPQVLLIKLFGGAFKHLVDWDWKQSIQSRRPIKWNTSLYFIINWVMLVLIAWDILTLLQTNKYTGEERHVHTWNLLCDDEEKQLSRVGDKLDTFHSIYFAFFCSCSFQICLQNNKQKT